MIYPDDVEPIRENVASIETLNSCTHMYIVVLKNIKRIYSGVRYSSIKKKD